MSIRTDILSALRTDFNVTGMQKSWKYVQRLDQIPDDSMPSYCVKLGSAVNKQLAENHSYWDLPIMVIVYFKCGTDTDNQGLLETTAEALIDLYEAVDLSTTMALDAVESAEILTITPYIDVGLKDRGWILLEYKLTYLGD